MIGSPEGVWTLNDGTRVRVLYHILTLRSLRATYDIGEAISWHSAFPEHSIRATMVKVK